MSAAPARVMGIGRPGQTPVSLNGKGTEKLGMILLVLLVLLVVGALPAWPHSRAWGYYPSGGMGLILLVVVLLLLFGRI